MKTMTSLLALLFVTNFSIAAEQAPKTLVLDPAVLRTQLLQSNLSLEQQEKLVEDAKTTVSLARAGLFPSLNISALLSGGFALSSVEFLVPFLVPSNWTALEQDKHLFEAEKHSYKALELNTYSSALALYFNVRTDNDIAQQYLQQAKDLREIGNYIQDAAGYGLASDEDVKNALGNAEAAEGQASKMQIAMTKEIAALRQALGLSLDTQILFSTAPAAATVPPSDVEAASKPSEIAQVVERALAVAPEQAQINELINAAQAGTWSRYFGWIDSASVSTAPASAGSSVSLSNLRAKGSIKLGLGIFPQIELSNRNIEEIQLRSTELKQENTQILEASILAAQEAQTEVHHFTSAESDLNDVYQATLKRYQMGLASIYDVLEAHRGLTSATINRIQAELDLTLLRVTLHRTMLTDEFGKITGCMAEAPKTDEKKSGGFWGWLGGLLGSQDDGKKDVSLLDLCKVQ